MYCAYLPPELTARSDSCVTLVLRRGVRPQPHHASRIRHDTVIEDIEDEQTLMIFPDC
jgi:hypothetical protein